MNSGAEPTIRFCRERGDCRLVGSDHGLELTIGGEFLGTYRSLGEVLARYPDIVACQPGDCFELAVDADVDEVIDALSIDDSNPEFPGERFDVTVNEWTLELSLEDFDMAGEHIASVDTIGAGDVGVSLYRFGPWLEQKFWGDDEQSFGRRIDSEFDARATALDFATSGLGGGFDRWDNLTVDSPFLTDADAQALVEALGPTIAEGGFLRLNGEDISGPDVVSHGDEA